MSSGETQVTEPVLRALFAEVFEIAPESLTDAASPETLDGWDSFGHMRLVTTLEESLGISLTMDQVLDIDSYGALRSIVLGAEDTP